MSDVRELPTGHPHLHGETPSWPTCFVERDRRRLANAEVERVFLGINGEAVDKKFADGRPVTLYITEGQIEVPGASSSVPKAYLQGHASLYDPSVRARPG